MSINGPSVQRRAIQEDASPGSTTWENSSLAPDPAPERDALVRQAATRAELDEAEASATDDEDQAKYPLNDLQRSIVAATQELKRRGHPANTP
jgi:hypothetical protein